MEKLILVLESVPSSSSPSLFSSSSQSSPRAIPPAHRRNRPIPRKGHTKSRRGCLNCKKRKVKCQETLPACEHCTRIGLRCEYPPTSSTLAPSYPNPNPNSIPSLQPTPTTFTLTDLRFFSHFIQQAYPPLPLNGGEIWASVAQISHSYPYLIHSMLGLAASSLSLTTSAAGFSQSALSHRVTAISLLNESLSEPCVSLVEGTARYATMMALTFQSSYMAEGMLDFVGMMRGCHVVAYSGMGGWYGGSLFGMFSREGHVSAVRMLGPGGEGAVRQCMVGECLAALGELGKLCRGVLEGEVLERVEKVVMLAEWDCVQSFDEITTVYEVLGTAGHEEFAAFVDPTNWTAQILLVYFVLVEYAVAYYAMGAGRSPFAYRAATNQLWVENLVGKLPEEYLIYMKWPVEFAKSLRTI